MRPRFIWSGAVAGLLLVGGGLWEVTQRSPDNPAAAFATARQQRDSVALGRLALRQCEAQGKPCYEAFLLALADSNDIALAMSILNVIANDDARVRADGHAYAHAIGMRGYDPKLSFGESFLRCTVAFQSGCYHGTIQAYLTSLPDVEKSELEHFCDNIPGLDTNLWLRFQCAHGLGHGVVMVREHDLPRGLAACDHLASGWDREACYGGAFMENVIGTETHHMPVRAATSARRDSAEAMHAHGMTGAADTAPARAPLPRINPLDPYYPCTILHPHYQRACWGMQTSIILELTQHDWRRTAALCAGAPREWRTTCYQSLGTNISGATVRNTARSIELCSLGDPTYQPWCFVGVVKNFVDVTSRPEDGLAFCREVPDGPNRARCYLAVGEQVGVLFPSLARRAPYCDALPPVDRAPCRYGARLDATRPPGLPDGV